MDGGNGGKEACAIAWLWCKMHLGWVWWVLKTASGVVRVLRGGLSHRQAFGVCVDLVDQHSKSADGSNQHPQSTGAMELVWVSVVGLDSTYLW